MSAEWRHLLDENHELRCRLMEVDAELEAARARIAELEKPSRRSIGFGEIERPRR